ncbi:hypothetical protein KM043_016762 [Ampulex compressa]|nr:hypothetical protein KM043_016762 [Ampulex compressa]
MKFAFALLAVLAVATPLNAAKIPNVGKGELAKELQDFLDLIPVDDVVVVVLEYLAEDEEFQNAVEYLQSVEFQQLARDVEALPEIKELMNYIQKAGVDIYFLVNELNKFIGIEEITPPQMALFATLKITGGIRGFVDDVKALLPLDKLEELYNYKLKNSKVFANFIAQLQSPEFQKIVDTVYANPNFQNLLSKAKAAGIDLALIKDLLYTILGIKVPTKPAAFF